MLLGCPLMPRGWWPLRTTVDPSTAGWPVPSRSNMWIMIAGGCVSVRVIEPLADGAPRDTDSFWENPGTADFDLVLRSTHGHEKSRLPA